MQTSATKKGTGKNRRGYKVQSGNAGRCGGSAGVDCG